MGSLQLQSPLFTSNLELKHRKQLQRPKVGIWFSGNDTLQRLKFRSLLQGRTKAMMDSSTTPIVLGLTSPAKPLDLSTFLQTSAILVVLYLISNFVVPDLISKYFEFDKVNENEKQRDDDNA